MKPKGPNQLKLGTTGDKTDASTILQQKMAEKQKKKEDKKKKEEAERKEVKKQ